MIKTKLRALIRKEGWKDLWPEGLGNGLKTDVHHLGGDKAKVDQYIEVMDIFDEFLEKSGLRKVCRNCKQCCRWNDKDCKDYHKDLLLCKNATCLFYLCGPLKQQMLPQYDLRLFNNITYKLQIAGRGLKLFDKAVLDYFRKELDGIARGIAKNVENAIAIFSSLKQKKKIHLF